MCVSVSFHVCLCVCLSLVTMSLTFFANHVYRDRYIDRSEQFIMVSLHCRLLSISNTKQI